MLKEGGLGLVGHLDQRTANEQLARFLRGNPAVADRAASDQGQIEQRDPFTGNNLATTLLPVRIEIVVTHQMWHQLLGPFRIDFGDGAGIESAGFDQFGCH